jgi:hypothetical protein
LRRHDCFSASLNGACWMVAPQALLVMWFWGSPWVAG